MYDEYDRPFPIDSCRVRVNIAQLRVLEARMECIPRPCFCTQCRACLLECMIRSELKAAIRGAEIANAHSDKRTLIMFLSRFSPRGRIASLIHEYDLD